MEAIFDSLKDVPLELQGLQQTWAHAYALYGIHSSNLPAKMQNKPSHWVAEPCMIQRRKLKWKWEKRRENEEEETLKLESQASATTWEGSHDIASSKPTWISSSISIETLLFLFTFFLLCSLSFWVLFSSFGVPTSHLQLNHTHIVTWLDIYREVGDSVGFHPPRSFLALRRVNSLWSLWLVRGNHALFLRLWFSFVDLPIDLRFFYNYENTT